MQLTLASILETSAMLHPERMAVIDGERKITYKALDEFASRIAGGLAREGIGHGDVVALTAPNCVEFVAAFYGVLKTGAAIMPLNFLLRAQEIREQLEFSGARAYLCHPGSPALRCGEEGYAAFEQVDDCKHVWSLADSDGALSAAPTLAQLTRGCGAYFPALSCDAGETAIVSFTSGTTGSPKAVCVSHGAEHTCLLGTIASFGFVKEDVMLAAAPLFTSIAQAILLGPTIAVGGTLLLHTRFDARAVLESMEGNRATIFLGVPTMYLRLAMAAREFTGAPALREHWRLAIYGGASMPNEVRRSFAANLGVTLQQAYGLTETRVTALGRDISAGLRSEDNLFPAPGFRFRVVDESMNDVPRGTKGELVLRGPGVMNGYMKGEALNAEIFREGWFHTGDVVEHDADGAYYIVGRIKDIISRGGYKIYPADVEQVLRVHPDVAEVAVVGVPDLEYGEEIAAVFVPHPGASVEVDALTDWVRAALPVHNQPRKLLIKESLPMTPTGKVMKNLVVQWFD